MFAYTSSQQMWDQMSSSNSFIDALQVSLLLFLYYFWIQPYIYTDTCVRDMCRTCAAFFSQVEAKYSTRFSKNRRIYCPSRRLRLHPLVRLDVCMCVNTCVDMCTCTWTYLLCSCLGSQICAHHGSGPVAMYVPFCLSHLLAWSTSFIYLSDDMSFLMHSCLFPPIFCFNELCRCNSEKATLSFKWSLLCLVWLTTFLRKRRYRRHMLIYMYRWREHGKEESFALHWAHAAFQVAHAASFYRRCCLKVRKLAFPFMFLSFFDFILLSSWLLFGLCLY